MLTQFALFASLIVPSKPPEPQAQWFRVKEEKGISWFTSPKYPSFWSFGIDCIDMGDKGKPDNPSYDGKKLFGTEKAWTEDTLKQLKSWSVNSLGGWSNHDLFNKHIPQNQRLPYFVVLHLGAYARAPWEDLYDLKVEKTISDAAKKLIPPLKNDPLLVGYFTDNELGWWGDTLFPTYLKLGEKSKGKQKLVSLIRQTYGNDFKKFKKDWITDRKSFNELLRPCQLSIVPGSTAIKVVNKWTYTLSRRYYSLVHGLVRKYDKNHLILGDRYAQYFDIDVVNASRGLIDVASSNLGAEWTDGTYSRFYLDTLSRMIGKPIVITEFYFGAMENQTGNRNSGTAFPKVQTQVERAKGFAKSLQTFAQHPKVIGAHWFQFYDEPPKGRADGEDWNMGMVDIHGKTYPLMVDVAQKSNPSKIHRNRMSVPKPAIPSAPAEPMKDRLIRWNKQVGYVPSATKDQWADLYVCKDKDNLYVGLLAMEYFDESLYVAKKIAEVDRPRFKFNINGSVFDLRFNGKTRPISILPPTEVAEWGGLKNTVIVKVPLSKIPMAGEGYMLKGTLWSHGRGRTMTWNQRLNDQ